MHEGDEDEISRLYLVCISFVSCLCLVFKGLTGDDNGCSSVGNTRIWREEKYLVG